VHGNIRLVIKLLGIKLRLNEFSTQTEISGFPGAKDGEFTNVLAHRLRFLIDEGYRFLPPIDLFEAVLIDVAYLNKYHPVHLDGLKWDGLTRIDTWLFDYGGAEGTEFNCAVGRLWLIAAVRRIRRPGVKFDTMPVWMSPQYSCPHTRGEG
jgi:predicted P-loop ATPase